MILDSFSRCRGESVSQTNLQALQTDRIPACMRRVRITQQNEIRATGPQRHRCSSLRLTRDVPNSHSQWIIDSNHPFFWAPFVLVGAGV